MGYTDMGMIMEAKISIQDAIYRDLRKNIINLGLEPGKNISEKEIALRYKVSRTPVREAFIHLAQEGLVRVIPQKETVVSLIDPARVEQELFLRETLETAILEPFTLKAGPEHFALMEGLIENQDAAFEAGGYIEFVDNDDRFHHTFFKTAGQDLGWEVLRNMSGHYHRVRLLTIRLKGIGKGVVGQHRKLLAALRKKDTTAARELLKDHLHKLDAEEELLKREFPAYFAAPDNENPYSVNFGELP
jgi:DNA-binding GntR family transcriptional regulator